jgi:hypothetical protein
MGGRALNHGPRPANHVSSRAQVATDHHQLGLVELNRQRYAEAAEHMHCALRIRRSIYVRGEHVDVATDLTQLGKIERGRGNHDAALGYLEEAYELLSVLPEEQASGQRAVKESVRVLEWLRNVARDRGDKAGARACRLVGTIITTRPSASTENCLSCAMPILILMTRSRYLQEQQTICHRHGLAAAGCPAPRDGGAGAGDSSALTGSQVPSECRPTTVTPAPPHSVPCKEETALLSALMQGRECVRMELVAAGKEGCAVAVSNVAYTAYYYRINTCIYLCVQCDSTGIYYM